MPIVRRLRRPEARLPRRGHGDRRGACSSGHRGVWVSTEEIYSGGQLHAEATAGEFRPARRGLLAEPTGPTGARSAGQICTCPQAYLPINDQV
jgi:hypothetical protein